MDSKEDQIYFYLLIASCIITLVFILYIFSLIKQHRKNVALYKEKIFAEVYTLENERKRYANDLHDDFGPLLSSIKMHVNSITLTQPDDITIRNRTVELLNELLESMHNTARNLIPNILEKKGLLPALQQYFNDLVSTKLVELNLSIKTELSSIERKSEIHIYRIIQEIITNALKHSNSKSISIHIAEDIETYQFSIKDFGIGFDKNIALEKTNSFGLKSINSRVDIIGGTLFIESNRKEGTHYILVIKRNK